MKIGASFHGDLLRLKAAEAGQFNIHASNVETQLPALQVIAGRTSELRAIVDEQNVAELCLVSSQAKVGAQQAKRFSVKGHFGQHQVAVGAQILECPLHVYGCV